MNKKNNKQFQGSAMRMEKAMLELINTTLFEKITVRLICERAGVNRSTFYAHYTDIYDMIGQLEANLQKELVSDYPASGSVVPLSLESFRRSCPFAPKQVSPLRMKCCFTLPDSRPALP